MRIGSAVLMFIMFLMLGSLATAQDSDESVAQPENAAAGAEETQDAPADGEAEEDTVSALDDLDDPEFADLDDQSYEEDDDDFVPTEEVPADEAIPFPSDI